MSDALDRAIEEAERFLEKCKAVKLESADYRKRRDERPKGEEWRALPPSRIPYAAAKRSSMDLSRALTDLRRPGAL